jgi:thiamine-phosphate pyrophosphorylase
MRRIDPARLRLMLVTDPDMAGDRPLEAIVAAAVRGGVTAVQLRDKTAPTQAFVERARALGALLAPLDVPLFVNDRVDVALAAGLTHVHVGQSDMRPTDVRRLMGERAVIGLSITGLADLRAEDLIHVDLLGVGPIHPTGSKADASPALGLDGLAEIRAATALPIVAIGGLSTGTVAAARKAGANGVAVVSAIMAAARPEEAARALRDAWGA